MVKYPDAHVEDYRLSLYPMGQFVITVPQCSSCYAKISWHDLRFFPGNITEMDDVERFVSVLVLRLGLGLARPSSYRNDACPRFKRSESYVLLSSFFRAHVSFQGPRRTLYVFIPTSIVALSAFLALGVLVRSSGALPLICTIDVKLRFALRSHTVSN
jgi:hypothetical protein